MNKFQVGQKVILNSRLAPATNGLYTVSDVIQPSENHRLLRDNSKLDGYAYSLEGTNLLVAEHALTAAE